MLVTALLSQLPDFPFSHRLLASSEFGKGHLEVVVCEAVFPFLGW